MNRPKREDFHMDKYEEAIDVMARYISDCKLGIKRYCDREMDTALMRVVELKEYCDELERELERIKSYATFDYILNLEGELKSCCVEIEKLKRALDNACEELDMLTQEFVPASNYPHITKEDELDRLEQWKEWAMKDE